MKKHNISVKLLIFSVQIWLSFAGYTQNPNEVNYNQFNEIQPNKQNNSASYIKVRSDNQINHANLPDGDIISGGNSLTIQEITGQWASGQGFKAYWECQDTNSITPETAQNDALIYPNPASNYMIVNLQNTVTGNLNVSITNLFGKIVLNKNYSGFDGTVKVHLNNQVDGLYIVKLDFNGGQIIKKLIIKRLQ